MIGAHVSEYSILGDDITVKLTAAPTKISNRTNNVRKENTMNTKVLEIITVQMDISLSEIADRLGVSYKAEQQSTPPIMWVVLVYADNGGILREDRRLEAAKIS